MDRSSQVYVHLEIMRPAIQRDGDMVCTQPHLLWSQALPTTTHSTLDSRYTDLVWGHGLHSPCVMTWPSFPGCQTGETAEEELPGPFHVRSPEQPFMLRTPLCSCDY